MNYFSPNTAAERYSKGRPNFHGNTINYIKDFLKLDNKFNAALDIACGTGLSTQALLNIATHVYGTDSSQAMLDFALQKESINYRLAKAEEQPFEDDFFDIITVCSGVHWFDIDQFLLEANRLLKNKSWLVLYDNFFLGEMEGNIEFKDWYHLIYLKKFPAPVRNDTYNWTNEQLNDINFELIHEERFNNHVRFNQEELVMYFTTQSNIISVVENKTTTYEKAEIWLQAELSTFFPRDNEPAIIYFENWVKYIQKDK